MKNCNDVHLLYFYIHLFKGLTKEESLRHISVIAVQETMLMHSKIVSASLLSTSCCCILPLRFVVNYFKYMKLSLTRLSLAL